MHFPQIPFLFNRQCQQLQYLIACRSYETSPIPGCSPPLHKKKDCFQVMRFLFNLFLLFTPLLPFRGKCILLLPSICNIFKPCSSSSLFKIQIDEILQITITARHFRAMPDSEGIPRHNPIWGQEYCKEILLRGEMLSFHQISF